MQSILVQRSVPTAILCGNNLAALGAVSAVIESGRKVPGDIAVIGADDIAFARYASPPLTTIRIDRREVGLLAFHALKRSIQSKRRLASMVSIGTHLVIRNSA